jgi:hypothetical protein
MVGNASLNRPGHAQQLQKSVGYCRYQRSQYGGLTVLLEASRPTQIPKWQNPCMLHIIPVGSEGIIFRVEILLPEGSFTAVNWLKHAANKFLVKGTIGIIPSSKGFSMGCYYVNNEDC